MVAIMDPVATSRTADAKSGTVIATFRVMPYFAQRAVNDARVAPVRCHQNMLGAGIGRKIEAFLVAGNADVSIPQKRLSIAGVA